LTSNQSDLWPRRVLAALAIVLIPALYLYDLGGMGMIGPDEPRYAWISRAMAHSGDWLIPRLWNEPWYEKPPLLYWLSGMGFAAGLDADWAPRLPVALLSISFLAFFGWRIREIWDSTTAVVAAVFLATSAGWLAYSHIAVTDLPLAAFFSAAVLLLCGSHPRPVLAGAALALAVLAKGLVPLVLFLPVLALNYRRLRLASIAVFLLLSIPWFAITQVRSGGDMFHVLFVQQTFGRFASAALQHVQPWWFYVPIALLLLFPWFPLLPLALRARGQDARVLGSVVAFGFFFFSLALNKLPGYLLPLLPLACALVALGLKVTPRPGLWLGGSLALLGLLPALAAVIPGAVVNGFGRTAIPWWLIWTGLAAGVAGAFFVIRRPWQAALMVTGAVAVLGLLWFESVSFGELDRNASARAVWRALHPGCFAEEPRTPAYGMYYYSNHRLPPCPKLDPDPQGVVR
jgi:4-amino-4-deoxy-L-arabinose transferase-like glycosyltransferase